MASTAAVIAQLIVGPLHRHWHARMINELSESDLKKELEDDEKGKSLEKKREEMTADLGKEDWLRQTVGVSEVVTYFVVYLLTHTYVFAFFITWVGLKTALGWRRQRVTPYFLRGGFISLPLNLINLAIAMLFGTIANMLKPLIEASCR